jgi:alpha-tubulin suppressor-like RCC1 family protein
LVAKVVTRLVVLALACLASGCEVVAGLDSEREMDPRCQAAALRCNGTVVEHCNRNGDWVTREECAVSCVAGACRDALVATGHHHTCARRPDASVWCWGQMDFGEVPDATAQPCVDDHVCTPVPTRLDALEGATNLSTLAHHTCAIRNGTVFCWGDNAHGQLGAAPVERSGVPPIEVKFPVSVEVADVQAGGGHVGGPENQLLRAGHTCALTRAGELYCWGANCAGQLGLGVGENNQCPTIAASCPPGAVATNLTIPTRVNLPFRAIQVGVGAAHTCALSAEGEVWCWGLNHVGQIGVSETMKCVIAPTRVPSLRRVTQIAIGALHGCALTDRGRVWCWGRTENHVLGQAFDGVAHAPVEVPHAGPVLAVGTGHGTHACARRADETLWCWGENENAEIGVIESIDVEGDVTPSPLGVTQVPIDSITTFAAGGNHTCAWDTSDVLRCWGENGMGALGGGSIGLPLTPSEVPLP